MLGTSPQQRRRPKADSSERLIPVATPGAPWQPRERPSAGPIADAYGRLLELPVPVVLAVLWLLGVVLLGVAVTTAYSAAVWLLAAMAIL